MSINDKLGIRMKEFYENVPKTRLVRRMPVAIRIDGKAFHTFTRGLKKPFDDVLIRSMQRTTKYLCQNIQGCVFGYTQSDEISLILIDYNQLDTDAWFGYEVQKIASVSASMATMAFNKFFAEEVVRTYEKEAFSGYMDTDTENYLNTLYKKIDQGAMFDARCFNIPKEEVTNLIYWRQSDAIRNSVQMVGQSIFSSKELEGKSCNNIQEMLLLKAGINWNEYDAVYKRGSACIKDSSGWVTDLNMPILKGENRKYLDTHIFVGE